MKRLLLLSTFLAMPVIAARSISGKLAERRQARDAPGRLFRKLRSPSPRPKPTTAMKL